MNFKRNLRYGMFGADVRWIKERLYALGWYAPTVTAIRKDHFGADTLRAVRSFQKANRDDELRRLTVDGVVGKRTWAAIVAAGTFFKDSGTDVALPAHIGSAAAGSIARALSGETEVRQSLVLTTLNYAFDPAVAAKYPRSLYIYGANLFDQARMQTVITAARIRAGAKRAPQYYSGGRMEMMLAAAAADPDISGADCSGGIVGIMRKLSLVEPTFDTTADRLASDRYSDKIEKSALRPGDWVGKSGHIGVYVGGGYVVEWMGGAYGCQLNRLTARAGWDFVAGRIRSQSAWTRFRRPKLY